MLYCLSSMTLTISYLAATLSFVAAFFLVRFRVHEASREEIKVEHKLEHSNHSNGDATPKSLPSEELPIFAANPHLEEVGPFRRGKPPTQLLEHFHTLCMILAAVGFVLAKIGVICYVWALLPTSARIVGTVLMGLCIAGFVGAVLLPVGFSPDSPSHVVGGSYQCHQSSQ